MNEEISKSPKIAKTTAAASPTSGIKLGKGFNSISSERVMPEGSTEIKESIDIEYSPETILSEEDVSLREYLEVIYNLEKRCYEINQIIKELQRPINPIKADHGFIGQIIFTLVISIIVLLLSVIVTLSMLGGGAAVILFTLPAIYSIYRIIKTLLNTHRSILGIRHAKEYNQSIPSREAENKKRLEALEKISMDTYSLLCKAYSRLGIHSKYQNLIAVSSLYEYIDTKRCDKLEGIDGAYNLFENEIKTNRIITQLNIIIDELEQIRMNQEYLYNAFQDTQHNINEVCQSINNSIHNIEKSSAFTAYISKVIEYNQFYEKRFDNTFFMDYRKGGYYGKGI